MKTARAEAKPQPAGDGGREREGRRQQRSRGKAGERQRRHRRRIAAGGGELAEGEIDPPDQPVDQRIGRRQQSVDRRQRQAVERHLKPIGEASRHAERAAEVAERGRVGGAAFGRRQPVADEKEEPRVGERRAVERQGDEIARLARPARLAEPAGYDMRLGPPVRAPRPKRRRSSPRPSGSGRWESMVICAPSGISAGSAMRQSRA